MNGVILKDRCEEHQLHLYLPPSYSKGGASYPVMYVQDGMELFDPAVSPVLVQMEHLFAQGGLPELILVGVEPNHRLHEYTPWFAKAISNQRFQEDFQGKGSEYLAYLVHTCKPYIDSKYRTESAPEKTGIIGFSLGGLISLYAAYLHPGVFHKIGSISGSYWYEGMVDFMQQKQMYQPDLRIYMDVGTEEGSRKTTIQKEMVPLTLEAHRILSESGFTREQLTLLVESGADHQLAYASGRFAGALQWLWENGREKNGTGRTAARASLDPSL